MSNHEQTIDTLHTGFQEAQQFYGGLIVPSDGDVRSLTTGNGLDVLGEGTADNLGFRQVEVDIRDYLSTPQILGRVLLMPNARVGAMSPAVIVEKPSEPGVVRVSLLDKPFADQGLTPGLRFGVAVEAQTQAPGFGGHGASGGFEGGHFGVALTGAAAEANAVRLVAEGDAMSDAILSDGLPGELSRLGLAEGIPIPRTQEIDTRRALPGQRLPLYWREDLQDADGAAVAEYQGTTELLIGAVTHRIGSAGLERAGQLVAHAARRG